MIPSSAASSSRRRIDPTGAFVGRVDAQDSLGGDNIHQRYLLKAQVVRPLPVGDELEIQRKNLWAAIAEYEKTSKTEFTARWESEDGVGKLDWHQMLDDVDQTVRRYEQAAETSRGDSKRSRCYAAVR